MFIWGIRLKVVTFKVRLELVCISCVQSEDMFFIACDGHMVQLRSFSMGLFQQRGHKSKFCNGFPIYPPVFVSSRLCCQFCIGFYWIYVFIWRFPLLILLTKLLIRCCAMALKYYRPPTDIVTGGIHSRTWFLFQTKWNRPLTFMSVFDFGICSSFIFSKQ